MSDIVILVAEARERAGKGAARAARRQGLVPAVIYGGKQEPQIITLESKVVEKEWNKGTFLSTIYDIEVGGKKERVLPRDVQLDPVMDTVTHADFLRVSGGVTVTLMVPVSFVNEDKCAGLTRGGVLNVVRHEIEMRCPADAIPEAIEVNLEDVDVGDSIHVSSVSLPKGAAPTITDRDFTIATIAAPSGMAEAAEEAEGEEAAEGE